MPGVPSSRSCDQCRAQKKKCVAATPPCQRCSRLQLPCSGFGQRRYKFIEGKQALVSAKQDKGVAAPSKALSNKLTNLASMLSDILDPTAPVGYNLLFSFGGFMCDVPTRLGVNEALDATSDAFVAAYVRFRAGRLEPDSQLLRKHGNALKALRSCLEVPSKAQASETLCALQLIMTYQAFLGHSPGISHASGVAQILRSRGCAGPLNDFEEKILLAQRGSVVVDALMNDKTHLSRQEWYDLVENKLDKDNPTGQVMRLLSRMPYLMRRARCTIREKGVGSLAVAQLAKECQELGESLQIHLEKTRAYLDRDDLSMLSHPISSPYLEPTIHAFRLRSYGLALLTGVIINRVTEGLGVITQDTYDQSQYLTEEIIKISMIGRKYRPLGSMCMLPYLSVAYTAADGPERKAICAALINEYRKDFAGADAKPITDDRLDWLTLRFQLKEQGSYDEVFKDYV